MRKFSVVIPVYNVEKFVHAAVQSVLNQTYKNFELLIVDDGSSDQSIEICRRFLDPRIKIIQQKNRGLSGARNTGIRYAKGEYLAFLDADDIWLPEKLLKHAEHLDNSPEAGVSFSYSQLIDENSQPLSSYILAKLSGITIPDLFRTNPVGNGSAPVIRREVLDEIKVEENRYGAMEDFYFDEDLRRNEDYEIWLRIAIQTNWKIEGIANVLTLYRVNPDSLSANLDKQQEAWEQALEKIRIYAPETISQWGSLSMSYHLRYLASSAVRLKQGHKAVSFIHRSIFQYWQILLEEPGRTLKALIFAYSLKFLPSKIYSKFDTTVSRFLGDRQKRRMCP